MSKVTVIGSGIVGRSWAVVFSRGGMNVSLYDTIDTQLEAASLSIKKMLETLGESMLLNDQTVDEVFERVSFSRDLNEALNGAVYVQECVPEILDLKYTVYSNLEAVLDSQTVIGSSTSGIACSKLSEGLTHKHRFIVAHPINPPHLMPLVELSPAPTTSTETVDFVKHLLQSVGQKPIVINSEVIGFVQNRLQYALLAESFRLIEDGICSPEDVDSVVKYGLATRWAFMGPFQTIDLNAPGGVSDYCERYLGNIYTVISTQDNNKKISQTAVDQIHEHQRTLYPVEDIPKIQSWRDKRLTSMLRHFKEEEQTDLQFFGNQ
jgi:3-hydroxyacyl-CoA dehydrogenase